MVVECCVDHVGRSWYTRTVSVDVPRDPTSERYAEKRAERDAYAAHLAEAKTCRWRVGAVGWAWKVARKPPDGPWETLPGELEHFPAEDLAQHRRRLAPWLLEQLGVTLVWLYLDYEAEDQGRLAFDVEVKL